MRRQRRGVLRLLAPESARAAEPPSDFGASAGDTFDLGNVLPSGWTDSQIAADLSLQYQVLDGGGLQWSTVTVAVPEPIELTPRAIVALGLLGRRNIRRVRQTARAGIPTS